MRAILLIALCLVGCGDDTTVMPPDMTVPADVCHHLINCCCAPNNPMQCVKAVAGTACASEQTACNLDGETGGTCFCDSGVWSCSPAVRDLSFPLD